MGYSGTLSIDYDGVEAVISDMKTYEEDINTIYADMAATVESLVGNGYMEAETADAYTAEFKALVGPDIEELSEVLSVFYTQLAQTTQIFAEHDSTKAGSFSC